MIKKMEDTRLPDVVLIKKDYFEDFRGKYIEIYNALEFNNIFADKDIGFVEDDISITEHHCLKGIHCDTEAWKLISCLYGKFYLVILNLDKHSKYYGKWTSFTLSDSKFEQVLVPPMHGVGHLCLSDKSIFHYKQSEQYNLARQSTVVYNDKRFNIFWPVTNVIVSQRDMTGDKSYVGII